MEPFFFFTLFQPVRHEFLAAKTCFGSPYDICGEHGAGFCWNIWIFTYQSSSHWCPILIFHCLLDVQYAWPACHILGPYPFLNMWQLPLPSSLLPHYFSWSVLAIRWRDTMRETCADDAEYKFAEQMWWDEIGFLLLYFPSISIFYSVASQCVAPPSLQPSRKESNFVTRVYELLTKPRGVWLMQEASGIKFTLLQEVMSVLGCFNSAFEAL
jgi:hypothetical protein